MVFRHFTLLSIGSKDYQPTVHCKHMHCDVIPWERSTLYFNFYGHLLIRSSISCHGHTHKGKPDLLVAMATDQRQS